MLRHYALARNNLFRKALRLFNVNKPFALEDEKLLNFPFRSFFLCKNRFRWKWGLKINFCFGDERSLKRNINEKSYSASAAAKKDFFEKRREKCMKEKICRKDSGRNFVLNVESLFIECRGDHRSVMKIVLKRKLHSEAQRNITTSKTLLRTINNSTLQFYLTDILLIKIYMKRQKVFSSRGATKSAHQAKTTFMHERAHHPRCQHARDKTTASRKDKFFILLNKRFIKLLLLLFHFHTMFVNKILLLPHRLQVKIDEELPTGSRSTLCFIDWRTRSKSFWNVKLFR